MIVVGLTHPVEVVVICAYRNRGRLCLRRQYSVLGGRMQQKAQGQRRVCARKSVCRTIKVFPLMFQSVWLPILRH